MDDEGVEQVARALGPDWPAFLGVVHTWMDKNRERLEGRWSFPMSDEELLNHELGAFLHDPADAKPVVFDYDATPADSFAFASTGVDGEHYSVLLDGPSTGAVVVTAPRAFGSEHVVVGASLREALALVCAGCGLTAPPNLAYGNRDAALAAIETSTDNRLWREIRDSLGVAPWPHTQARLDQLRDDHLAHVRRRRD